MTRKEKIGLCIIIAMLAFFMVGLWLSFRPAGSGAYSPSESPIVRQRILNLNKGR